MQIFPLLVECKYFPYWWNANISLSGSVNLLIISVRKGNG
jgi:hypothetical protein